MYIIFIPEFPVILFAITMQLYATIISPIDSSIIDIINPYNDSAAVDSSVVKTCRDTTAQRRRKNGKYKDHESSWGYGTRGYEYGRKVHASIDADSLSVMEWKITTASVYDKNIALPYLAVC